MQHAAEFRRCLLELDVNGIMAIWNHTNPHLPRPSEQEALIQLHIARVEAKSIPSRAKAYSLAWLAEQGYQKANGSWVPAPKNGVAEAVGISSRTAGGYVLPFNRKVMDYMRGALLNEMAKGVTEPEVQKAAMLKARERVRFKARLV